MKSGLVSALVCMSCILFAKVEMLKALRVKLSSEAGNCSPKGSSEIENLMKMICSSRCLTMWQSLR